MDQSNMIAQEIETHGVRTFSAKEMAFNILGLMHPILFSITQVEPVWGDLSGGFGRIADLADMATCIRVNMNKKLSFVVRSLATMPRNLKSSMVLRPSAFFKPSISHLVPLLLRIPRTSWGTYP